MTPTPNNPVRQYQPEISLVQDLRMDAEMLKYGFQKNLTELWHSVVVRDAALDAIEAATEIKRLRAVVGGSKL